MLSADLGTPSQGAPTLLAFREGWRDTDGVIADTTLCNLRDLGGIPLIGGGAIRNGVLYRGDAPVAGDTTPALQPWPPKTVIDVRTDGERASMAGEPWPDGVTIKELSVYGDLDPFALARQNGTSDVSELLTQLFTKVIETRSAILVDVVSAIATAEPPSMVHCTGGKDRTALVIALVLDTVGARTEAIIQDHLRTNAVIEQLVTRMARALGKDIDAPMSLADEPSLRAALELWHAHPGGSAGYLRDNGLRADHLDALRARLTNDPTE